MNKFLSAPALFFLLGALFVFLSGASQAKEGDATPDMNAIMPAAHEKSVLMPNLTVNFQLNSTLGAKETAYYSKIVEKILANLPKTIKLEGDEKGLLTGSNRYDTLKVIAYLPASDEEIADNPLNKVTKRFDISFELPREKKLVRLSKEKEVDTSLVEPRDSYDDFMAKIGLEYVDGEVSIHPSTVAALIPVKETKNVSPRKKMNKVEHKAMPQNLLIKYFDDGTAVSEKQIQSFKSFALQIKESKRSRLKIITQTVGSPFESWVDVRNKRLKSLLENLNKYGVDMKKISVDYIHLKSESKQSIRLEI